MAMVGFDLRFLQCVQTRCTVLVLTPLWYCSTVMNRRKIRWRESMVGYKMSFSCSSPGSGCWHR